MHSKCLRSAANEATSLTEALPEEDEFDEADEAEADPDWFRSVDNMSWLGMVSDRSWNVSVVIEIRSQVRH